MNNNFSDYFHVNKKAQLTTLFFSKNNRQKAFVPPLSKFSM
ncbi:hypothetical protein RV03_GL003391 [Enterococcus gallinarum]|nr:hypothetical protein RV03_GL003391 [Enterococcus gallinarum]